MSGPAKRPISAHATINGPWSLEVGDHTHRYVLVKDADDRPVYYKYGSGTKAEADADEVRARLASSAPDLLAALRDACDMIRDLIDFANNNGGMYDDNEFAEGRAAIAKAEGQS